MTIKVAKYFTLTSTMQMLKIEMHAGVDVLVKCELCSDRHTFVCQRMVWCRLTNPSEVFPVTFSLHFMATCHFHINR